MNETIKKTLPKGWRWVRLGEVCEQDRTIVEAGSLQASRLPYLGLEHVEANTGRILREPGSAGDEDGKSTTFAFSIKHVLYGKLRPYLNKVALPNSAGRCTTELIPLLPGKLMTREFLACVLRRPETVHAAMKDKTGSRMPRADMGELMRLEVPLPPLAEQKRIAAILKEQLAAVDRARAAAEAQLQAAQSLSASFLSKTFERVGGRSWPRMTLGEILRLRKEIVHPRDNPRGRKVFVGLEHLEPNTGRRLGQLEVEMANLTGRKPRFHKGDIVYGYLRPYLNKVWIAEFDGLCSVDQYVYSMDGLRFNTEFVACFMRSPVFLRRAPIDVAPGYLPRIRTQEVAAVELDCPPLQQQARIMKRLSALMAKTNELRATFQAQCEAVTALPSAILRQAFSGEL